MFLFCNWLNSSDSKLIGSQFCLFCYNNGLFLLLTIYWDDTSMLYLDLYLDHLVPKWMLGNRRETKKNDKTQLRMTTYMREWLKQQAKNKNCSTKISDNKVVNITILLTDIRSHHLCNNMYTIEIFLPHDSIYFHL